MDGVAFEDRLRGVVADRLGVDREEVRPDVSLTDDLAADSLDMLEIALAVEDEIGVRFDDLLLDRVRSFGDLVAATSRLVEAQAACAAARNAPPPLVHVRVFGAGRMETSPRVDRVVALTPYEMDELVDDARLAGPGGTLEIGTAPGVSLQMLDAVVASCTRRGVDVVIRAGDAPTTASIATTVASRRSADVRDRWWTHAQA
jgi:acyl carrier protein